MDGEEVRVACIIGPKVSTSFPKSSSAVIRNLHTDVLVRTFQKGTF
jgi:hypothetical protein